MILSQHLKMVPRRLYSARLLLPQRVNNGRSKFSQLQRGFSPGVQTSKADPRALMMHFSCASNRRTEKPLTWQIHSADDGRMDGRAQCSGDFVINPVGQTQSKQGLRPMTMTATDRTTAPFSTRPPPPPWMANCVSFRDGED